MELAIIVLPLFVIMFFISAGYFLLVEIHEKIVGKKDEPDTK